MKSRRPAGPSGRSFSRRQVLGMGAAAVAAVSGVDLVTPSPVGARSETRLRAMAGQDAIAALRPTIRPRSDWGRDLAVKGRIEVEDDVRFLLVHHTASTNDYGADDVIGQIRGFYDFHTGPEKGWPDVAYNFFIDRFGGIWEGRQGSIAGPVRGDATGGSQGFALLCSLIGNHAESPVTPEQQTSLTRLLAWLAESYAIDTTPGATTTFTSRGSSRWPIGTEVAAATISGHRDMSTTSCPGDFAYGLLATEIPTQVSALRPDGGTVAATSTTSDPGPTTTEPAAPSTTVTSPNASTASPSSSIGATTEQPAAEVAAGAPEAPTGTGGDGLASPGLVIIGAALGAVAAVGGLVSRIWTGPGD